MTDKFLSLSYHFFFTPLDCSPLNFFFCRFLSQCFEGFLLLHLVRFIYPFFLFFLIKLHENMHFHWKFMRFSNLENFRVFSDFDCFSLKWSMGFCVCMLLTWFLWFNFINFVDYENFRNKGSCVLEKIEDFDQLDLNWWNHCHWLIDR